MLFQRREFVGIGECPRAPQLSKDAFDEAGSIRIENHLVHARRAAAAELRTGVDESRALALIADMFGCRRMTRRFISIHKSVLSNGGACDQHALSSGTSCCMSGATSDEASTGRPSKHVETTRDHCLNPHGQT